jgi:hypothetical protein
VNASIRFDGGEPAQLLSLFRWLREDASLVGRCTVGLGESTEPGHMGAAEIIDLTLTHLTAVTSVAIAYAAWRDSRAQRPRAILSGPGFEIVFVDSDLHIVFKDASADTIEAVVAAYASAVEVDAAAG